jgi:uncharacterized protein
MVGLPNVWVSDGVIADFCRRHNISRLSFFGSVLGEDFRKDSDIDIVVEFSPGNTPGLFTMARLEGELSHIFDGRKVDLRTPQDLSRYFRDEVLSNARVGYAARG